MVHHTTRRIPRVNTSILGPCAHSGGPATAALHCSPTGTPVIRRTSAPRRLGLRGAGRQPAVSRIGDPQTHRCFSIGQKSMTAHLVIPQQDTVQLSSVFRAENSRLEWATSYLTIDSHEANAISQTPSRRFKFRCLLVPFGAFWCAAASQFPYPAWTRQSLRLPISASLFAPVRAPGDGDKK
jgi:hypothetical protein